MSAEPEFWVPGGTVAAVRGIRDLTVSIAAGWWYKPDFIINELNVNSAITSPAHEEVVPYTEKTVVKGYAYAGTPFIPYT